MIKRAFVFLLFSVAFFPHPLSAEKNMERENRLLREQIADLKAENESLRAQMNTRDLSAEVPAPIPQTQGKSLWESKSKAKKGFLDFNVYYDVEDFGVFTLNAGAELPHNFSYFSLTNFSNPLDASDHLDSEDFYTEQHLSWHLPKDIPLSLNALWNMRSGKDNDRLRFGPVIHFHEVAGLDEVFKYLNASYKIVFHLLTVDHPSGYTWQMEHVYRVNVLPEILDERVYVGGFADHELGTGEPKVVTEHQVGLRVIDNWYLVSEYRFNEFRSKDKASLGLGVEYVVQF